MTRHQRKYKRLPGRPFSLFGVCSLWQGEDHLLWVESVFFSENYKRFFYSDIQSIVTERGDTHTLWSVIWGVLGLICSLIAILVQGTPYVSATFATVFFIGLGINLALGPSCAVYLQTGVQIQNLATLKRVRTAQKAVARIKASVEKIQGPLARPQRSGANTTATEGTPTSAPARAQFTATVGPGARTAVTEVFKPLLHNSLFGCLLGLGLLEFSQLLLKSLTVAVLEAFLHGAVLILVVVGLTCWHRHIKGTLVAKINWLALVFIIIGSAAGYALYIAAAVRHPQINYHHWEMFKSMFQLRMIDHPLAATARLAYAAGSLALGVFGLLATGRMASRTHRAEANRTPR